MDPVIGVILAAALGGLASYLAAARKLSGKVATSDATELWAESRSIREWSAERIQELQAEIDKLEAHLRDLEGHNDQLHRENVCLMDTIDDLRVELRNCRAAGEFLTQKLAQAEGSVGAEESPESDE